MNIRKLSTVLLAGAAGSTLLLSASAAGAAVTPSHHGGGDDATKSAAVPLAAPRVPFSLPAGNTVVTKAFTAYAGSQTPLAVQCPGTERHTGGGAFVASSDLSVNINSSLPEGSSWAVDVNNPLTTSTNATVYAVCMAYSPYYKVVTSGPATVAPEQVNSTAAVCPTGTSVVGGGGQSSTANTDVSINSTVPNLFAGGTPAGGSRWPAPTCTTRPSPRTRSAGPSPPGTRSSGARTGPTGRTPRPWHT